RCEHGRGLALSLSPPQILAPHNTPVETQKKGSLNRRGSLRHPLPGDLFLRTFRMQHPERIPSVRPDEQKRILSLGNIGEGLFYIGDGRRLMAVDAQDHVSPAQASVVGGA